MEVTTTATEMLAHRADWVPGWMVARLPAVVRPLVGSSDLRSVPLAAWPRSIASRRCGEEVVSAPYRRGEITEEEYRERLSLLRNSR